MELSFLGAAFAAEFEVLRALSHGPEPEVYLARQRSLDRIVAVKVLARAPADPARRSRLIDEARVLAQLKHPRLVNVFTLGGEDLVPYIAMEYVDGDTLRTILDDRRPGLREFFKLVIGVTQGLQYIHESAVVHGNLKPENILVDSTGNARILDFGLALDASAARHEGETIFGTPAYMAPERIAGAACGPAADLYALGAIMVEMLTGEPPFVGSTETILDAQRNRPPVSPRTLRPELPVVLEEIVMALLQKRPERRPASAGALLERLVDLAALGDLWTQDLTPLLAGSSSPPPPPLCRRWRHRVCSVREESTATPARTTRMTRRMRSMIAQCCRCGPSGRRSSGWDCWPNLH